MKRLFKSVALFLLSRLSWEKNIAAVRRVEEGKNKAGGRDQLKGVLLCDPVRETICSMRAEIERRL